MKQIIAFVGPKNGGKDYALEQFKNSANGVDAMLSVDFSDGIRDFVRILTFGQADKSISVDVNSQQYRDWKEKYVLKIKDWHMIDGDCDYIATGRDLLIRIGEGVKELFGEKVWAKYTANKVHEFLRSVGDDGNVLVLVGSVRFYYEAAELVKLAREFDCAIDFIFCNFNHAPKGVKVHETEKLAQLFVDQDIKHREVITNQIIELCQKL